MIRLMKMHMLFGIISEKSHLNRWNVKDKKDTKFLHKILFVSKRPVDKLGLSAPL